MKLQITITAEFEPSDQELLLESLVAWVEFLKENEIYTECLIEPENTEKAETIKIII